MLAMRSLARWLAIRPARRSSLSRSSSAAICDCSELDRRRCPPLSRARARSGCSESRQFVETFRRAGQLQPRQRGKSVRPARPGTAGKRLAHPLASSPTWRIEPVLTWSASVRPSWSPFQPAQQRCNGGRAGVVGCSMSRRRRASSADGLPSAVSMRTRRVSPRPSNSRAPRIG